MRSLVVGTSLVVLSAYGCDPEEFCGPGDTEVRKISERSFFGETGVQMVSRLQLSYTSTTGSYVDGTPTQVTVRVDPIGDTMTEVSESLGGFGASCAPQVWLRSTVKVATADGVFDESFEADLAFESVDRAFVRAFVPPEDLRRELVQRVAQTAPPSSKLSWIRFQLDFGVGPSPAVVAGGATVPEFEIPNGFQMGDGGMANMSWCYPADCASQTH